MAAKRSHRRRRPPATPQKEIPLAASATDTMIGGLSTQSGETQLPQVWGGGGTSDATPTDEIDGTDVRTTTAGLIQQLLTGGIQFGPYQFFRIAVVGYLAAVAWIFLQDNASGRLNTQEGLSWVFTKLLYFTAGALVLIAGGLIVLLIAGYIRDNR